MHSERQLQTMFFSMLMAMSLGNQQENAKMWLVTFVLIHIILYNTFKTFLLFTTDPVSCIENLITFIAF